MNSNVLKAQDVHFSQFNRSVLLLNPSLAGSYTEDFRMILCNRQQWKSVANPYKTIAAGADVRMNKNRWKTGFMGLGLNFYSDRAGDSQMGITRVDLSVSYKAILDRRNIFGGGIQIGYAQHSLSTGKLMWGSQFDGDQYNSSLPSGELFSTSFSYIDVGEGITWQGHPSSSVWLNAGAAMFHTATPRYSYYDEANVKIYRKEVIHGDAFIRVKNSNYGFAPEFMYVRQGAAQEITLGALEKITFRAASVFTGFVNATQFIVGLHYRVGDAVITSMGIEQGSWSVRLSYDVNASKLSNASRYQGGYEISLKYTSPKYWHYKKMRAKF